MLEKLGGYRRNAWVVFTGISKYYGEMYEVDSNLYIEFILDKFSHGIGHAVFKINENYTKNEITERMPSIVEFIKFVRNTSSQIKNSAVNNCINSDIFSDYKNKLLNDANLPFTGVDNFLKQFMAQHYIKIVNKL